MSGLHYLVLSERASWDDVRAALRDEADFLRDWIATERVQTNEPRRCWWLLPCFLEVGRRHALEELDVVELGCSGGLNLIWDRYGYEYEHAVVPGEPSFGGEERSPVPLGLLGRFVTVRTRVGVDLAPPDLRTDDGVRLLKSFVWGDQAQRLADVDAAVGVWRREPPEIVVGDMLEELPALLARGPNLVFSTAAINYLPRERREQLRALIADARVPFVETWQHRDGSHDYYGLFVDGDEVAHAEFHGAWLDWH